MAFSIWEGSEDINLFDNILEDNFLFMNYAFGSGHLDQSFFFEGAEDINLFDNILEDNFIFGTLAFSNWNDLISQDHEIARGSLAIISFR